MRDRLIELISQVQYMGGLEGQLADYLLKNGVIVPPYKVNTKVCVIASQTGDDRNLYIFEDIITHYRICDGCTIMCLEKHLGVPSWRWNDVFLTQEEAEKALERSANDNT